MNKADKESIIGIIGFGAGGLTLFVQLVDTCIKNSKKPTILLFEKAEIAKGLAYSTLNHSHILNLDVHTMSVAHTKKEHFYNWFKNNQDKWGKDYPEISINNLFPPRGIFGSYLNYTFKEYLNLAKNNGINVVTHQQEVVEISPLKNSTLLIKDVLSNEYVVNAAVLSIGNLESDQFNNLINKKGYYHSPWNIPNIEEKYPIVIIGSRLTAIDAVLSLHNKGVKNIYMISRSGKLPKIIGPTKTYHLKYLNKDTILKNIHDNKISINKLWELFNNEIEHVEGQKIKWGEIISASSFSLNEFKDEIELVMKGSERAWQSVLIAFYPIVPWVWSLLTDEDKKIFLENYFSTWLTYLAAFPLQNAIKIKALLESGTLHVEKGFREVKYNETKKGFDIYLESGEKIFTKSLINATGSGHNLNSSKLLQNLYKNGQIKKDVLGGVKIDVANCLIIREKNANSNIFAIGEVTFGSWLATADLGQLSRQSELLVGELIKRI